MGLRLLAATLLAMLLPGCAVVTVTSSDGAVKLTRHWGVLGVHVDSGHTAAVDLQYLGYALTPLGTYGGFGTARVFAAPPGCRLVVWPAGELPSTWKSIVSEVAGSCIVH